MEIRKKMKASQDLELVKPPKSIAKATALTKQIVKLHAKGKTIEQIAKKTKLHPTKIRMMVKEHICSPERLEALNDLTYQRSMQAYQIDLLIASRMESALEGNNQDLEAARKLMSDQNKLLGLTEKSVQQINVTGDIDHNVDIEVSGEIAVVHDFSKAQANLDKYISGKSIEKVLAPNTHQSDRDIGQLLSTLEQQAEEDGKIIIDAEIIEDDESE